MKKENEKVWLESLNALCATSNEATRAYLKGSEFVDLTESLDGNVLVHNLRAMSHNVGFREGFHHALKVLEDWLCEYSASTNYATEALEMLRVWAGLPPKEESDIKDIL